MKLEELTTIAQLTGFLAGTQTVAFSVLGSKDECYRFFQTELVRWGYLKLPRSDKGVVTRYLMKISGYSRQQLTRLVARYRDTGRLQRQQRTVAGFKKKYSDQDIRLLAAMDERHETPCGHTLKKLCERASVIHGDTDYQVLSKISVSHLYNLRKSSTYQRQRRHFEKTRSRVSTLGERRKPDPDGQPGFLRIDTVHQGDQDKQKGVYHINAVDEVTQFEAVCSVEKISELYLIPALEAMFETFPFVILGFHADNGSEYINKRVAELLGKLSIEFTKSRSRQTNDNALVEGKNASIVRKQFGYSHIQQRFAARINAFNQQYLNPYINYHRPCFFPETHIDAKGKRRTVYLYKNMMTPYDKLRSLTGAEGYLKPGMNFEILNRVANQTSDNQAADQLIVARQKLFKSFMQQDLSTG